MQRQKDDRYQSIYMHKLKTNKYREGQQANKHMHRDTPHHNGKCLAKSWSSPNRQLSIPQKPLNLQRMQSGGRIFTFGECYKINTILVNLRVRERGENEWKGVGRRWSEMLARAEVGVETKLPRQPDDLFR